jgi:hypothetical protein
MDAGGRYEIDQRLLQKEGEFQKALLAASGVTIDLLADDGVIVPGQSVKVSLVLASHGPSELAIRQVRLNGFEGDSTCRLTTVMSTSPFGFGRGGRGGPPPGPPLSSLKKDVAGRCEMTVKVPANARATEPYWHRDGEAGRYTFDADAAFGLPYRPTPFTANLSFEISSDGQTEPLTQALPVQYRYEGNIFSGEKRTELLVVPAVSVRVSPEVAIIPLGSIRATGPAGAQPIKAGRELRVTLVNDAPGASENIVKLDLPGGWTASPASQLVKFARADESQTVRFQINPAATTVAGAYRIRAVVTAGAQSFDRGYQVIEYPHIRRQHIYHQAEVALKVLDVKTAPHLTVGYIDGVGDDVPTSIAQLGTRVEFITADDLAWGDLSRFDAIVTGVRAYERRADLRANNSRLLSYVFGGGTLIVQYNKFEFNEAEYAPYPAKVSANRVTDEFSPVKVLAPSDALLNWPNKIGEPAWKGWVQERGLYFLGDRDPRYHDLVALEDPFPFNKGEKRGALVETTYGKGHWVYVGLGLWRQLPAGTDGAYPLLANLISLGKLPNGSGAGKPLR